MLENMSHEAFSIIKELWVFLSIPIIWIWKKLYDIEKNHIILNDKIEGEMKALTKTVSENEVKASHIFVSRQDLETLIKPVSQRIDFMADDISLIKEHILYKK